MTRGDWIGLAGIALAVVIPLIGFWIKRMATKPLLRWIGGGGGNTHGYITAHLTIMNYPFFLGMHVTRTSTDRLHAHIWDPEIGDFVEGMLEWEVAGAERPVEFISIASGESAQVRLFAKRSGAAHFHLDKTRYRNGTPPSELAMIAGPYKRLKLLLVDNHAGTTTIALDVRLREDGISVKLAGLAGFMAYLRGRLQALGVKY